ncbi:MAG: leucine-rich repeat domain-containing protein [Promethearchaeota archaeon]
MLNGRILRARDPKLRKFRNSLRRMWLSLIINQDQKIKIKQESLIDHSEGSIFKIKDKIKEYMKLKFSNVEMKRLINYSICLCPICLRYEEDMIWDSYSEAWYCENCYNQITSPITDKKILDDLNKLFLLNNGGHDDYDIQSSWNNVPLKFFKNLSIINLTRIILDPELDLIKNIIKKKVETKEKYNSYQIGIMFNERVSQFISKKLMDVLNELNDEKIDSLMELGLLQFIHFRDFITLSCAVKKYFFVTFYKYAYNHYDREIEEFTSQLGQIRHLKSSFILDYVKDLIRENRINELYTYKWVDLLEERDFIDLCGDPEYELLKILLEINKTNFDDKLFYGLKFPFNLMRLVNDKIGETIEQVVIEENELDLIIFFSLDFFDFLSEEQLISLFQNSKFIELLYSLYNSAYLYNSDNLYNLAKTKISKFFEDYKQQWIPYLKLIIIDKFKNGDLIDIFRLWDYGWLLDIPEDDFCYILAQEELHLLNKLLKAVHFHGFEKNYDHTCASFPFLYNFIKMPTRIRNALKTQVIEVIKNGEMEAIVPLVGIHYLEILDIDEIYSLINDPKVKLLEIINQAAKEHNEELYYFNSEFFIWTDKFNNLIQKFGFKSIFKTRSLLELLYIPRYDMISKHDKRFIEEGEESVEIAGRRFYMKNGFLDLQNLFIQDISKIKDLFSLESLKVLNLSFNWITELPRKITRLQSLEKLIIQESRLQKIPEYIANLKNLKVLDIQGNYLEKLPQCLLESDSLKHILLSVFKYHELPILHEMIRKLQRKGIKVSIHDMHFLD